MRSRQHVTLVLLRIAVGTSQRKVFERAQQVGRELLHRQLDVPLHDAFATKRDIGLVMNYSRRLTEKSIRASATGWM